MKQKTVRQIVSGVFVAAMVFSSLTVSPAITAKAATAVKLEEGTKYTIVSRNSGKALAVENDSKSNNAKVVQKTLDSSDSQIWTLDYDNNGYYQIINENSGKVLDVPNSSTKEGEAIIQWNKGSGNNQKWKISETGNGYYRISPKTTSKYGLNVAKNSTNDNAKIQQWTYHGDANEQWEIREVNENPYGEGTIRLEAENGTRRNGANIMYTSNASGGKMVGDLSVNSEVSFVVNCNYARSYELTIYYATAEARTFDIYTSLNNGSGMLRKTLKCDSTGGWEKVGKSETTILYLSEGRNIISLSGKDGYAPNVDYIEISGFNTAGSIAGDNVICVEAEDSSCLEYGVTKMDAPAASGGKLIGNVSSSYSAEYVIYDEDLAPGKYTMRFYYASAEDRTIGITMDGTFDMYSVDCPSTGGWTKVGKPVEVEVDIPSDGFRMWLGAGDGGGYAPNIDYFEIIKK